MVREDCLCYMTGHVQEPWELGIVERTWNARLWKTEAEGSKVQGQPGPHCETIS